MSELKEILFHTIEVPFILFAIFYSISLAGFMFWFIPKVEDVLNKFIGGKQ